MFKFTPQCGCINCPCTEKNEVWVHQCTGTGLCQIYPHLDISKDSYTPNYLIDSYSNELSVLLPFNYPGDNTCVIYPGTGCSCIDGLPTRIGGRLRLYTLQNEEIPIDINALLYVGNVYQNISGGLTLNSNTTGVHGYGIRLPINLLEHVYDTNITVNGYGYYYSNYFVPTFSEGWDNDYWTGEMLLTDGYNPINTNVIQPTFSGNVISNSADTLVYDSSSPTGYGILSLDYTSNGNSYTNQNYEIYIPTAKNWITNIFTNGTVTLTKQTYPGYETYYETIPILGNTETRLFLSPFNLSNFSGYNNYNQTGSLIFKYRWRINPPFNALARGCLSGNILFPTTTGDLFDKIFDCNISFNFPRIYETSDLHRYTGISYYGSAIVSGFSTDYYNQFLTGYTKSIILNHGILFPYTIYNQQKTPYHQTGVCIHSGDNLVYKTKPYSGILPSLNGRQIDIDNNSYLVSFNDKKSIILDNNLINPIYRYDIKNTYFDNWTVESGAFIVGRPCISNESTSACIGTGKLIYNNSSFSSASNYIISYTPYPTWNGNNAAYRLYFGPNGRYCMENTFSFTTEYLSGGGTTKSPITNCKILKDNTTLVSKNNLPGFLTKINVVYDGSGVYLYPGTFSMDLSDCNTFPDSNFLYFNEDVSVFENNRNKFAIECSDGGIPNGFTNFNISCNPECFLLEQPQPCCLYVQVTGRNGLTIIENGNGYYDITEKKNVGSMLYSEDLMDEYIGNLFLSQSSYSFYNSDQSGYYVGFKNNPYSTYFIGHPFIKLNSLSLFNYDNSLKDSIGDVDLSPNISQLTGQIVASYNYTTGINNSYIVNTGGGKNIIASSIYPGNYNNFAYNTNNPNYPSISYFNSNNNIWGQDIVIGTANPIVDNTRFVLSGNKAYTIESIYISGLSGCFITCTNYRNPYNPLSKPYIGFENATYDLSLMSSGISGYIGKPYFAKFYKGYVPSLYTFKNEELFLFHNNAMAQNASGDKIKIFQDGTKALISYDPNNMCTKIYTFSGASPKYILPYHAGGLCNLPNLVGSFQGLRNIHFLRTGIQPPPIFTTGIPTVYAYYENVLNGLCNDIPITHKYPNPKGQSPYYQVSLWNDMDIVKDSNGKYRFYFGRYLSDAFDSPINFSSFGGTTLNYIPYNSGVTEWLGQGSDTGCVYERDFLYNGSSYSLVVSNTATRPIGYISDCDVLFSQIPNQAYACYDFTPNLVIERNGFIGETIVDTQANQAPVILSQPGGWARLYPLSDINTYLDGFFRPSGITQIFCCPPTPYELKSVGVASKYIYNSWMQGKVINYPNTGNSVDGNLYGIYQNISGVCELLGKTIISGNSNYYIKLNSYENNSYDMTNFSIVNLMTNVSDSNLAFNPKGYYYNSNLLSSAKIYYRPPIYPMNIYPMNFLYQNQQLYPIYGINTNIIPGTGSYLIDSLDEPFDIYVGYYSWPTNYPGNYSRFSGGLKIEDIDQSYFMKLTISPNCITTAYYETM